LSPTFCSWKLPTAFSFLPGIPFISFHLYFIVYIFFASPCVHSNGPDYGKGEEGDDGEE
jgi:hypothetical protein